MPHKQLSTTKNGYQKIIWTYSKRRDEIRVQYKGRLKTKEYSQRVLAINNKIITCRHAIKRYEVKEKKLNELNLIVLKFIDINVRSLPNIIGNTKDAVRKNLARKIFCKYAIDVLLLRPKDVSDYLGFSRINRTQAGTVRIRFNRSFKTNKDNKEMYHRFLNYIKQIKNDNAKN